MSAKRYRAVDEIHRDGVVYAPDSVIEIEDGEAAPLLELGAIRLEAGEAGSDPEPEAPGREDVIAAGCRALARGRDPASWTAAGPPAVDAVEAVVGFGLSASERDAGWATVEAAGQKSPE